MASARRSRRTRTTSAASDSPVSIEKRSRLLRVLRRCPIDARFRQILQNLDDFNDPSDVGTSINNNERVPIRVRRQVSSLRQHRRSIRTSCGAPIFLIGMTQVTHSSSSVLTVSGLTRGSASCLISLVGIACTIPAPVTAAMPSVWIGQRILKSRANKKWRSPQGPRHSCPSAITYGPRSSARQLHRSVHPLDRSRAWR
jgi:hypothetical protein